MEPPPAVSPRMGYRPVTCYSCASMGYWFAASVVAWAILAAIGFAWQPLQGSGDATLLLAAGIGCGVNWQRNRTGHCLITAPLFLAAGLAALANRAGWIHIHPAWYWLPAIIGTALAFLWERRAVAQPRCT